MSSSFRKKFFVGTPTREEGKIVPDPGFFETEIEERFLFRFYFFESKIVLIFVTSWEFLHKISKRILLAENPFLG
ncbi:hypothetical protein DLM75_00210 [Leptospira stimsonii]|uniref:Uncharacterized protein n=1 Tax=Leptospira stimsonii TaxID=2202203 RepID=A0A396ZD99_9LEPT|nr:hypothetical protein DLM75_00210 [Leptospira stimsonii]